MTISLSVSNPAADGTAANAADVNTPVNELKVHLENVLNGAQNAEVHRFVEISAPSATASTWKVYATTAGLFVKDGSGNVYTVGGKRTVETFTEGAAPSIPATGDWKLYFKSTGMYFMDDAGTETQVGSGGGFTLSSLLLTQVFS